MRLKGKVLDADTGRPLANLGVGMTRTNVHVHARTGTDGGFVLDRLVPGRTIVMNVRSDRDYFGEVREITLPLEGTEFEIPPFRLLPIAPGRRGYGSGDLGIDVSNRQGPPTIKTIAPGSPAAKAGIEAGSVIRSVDGRDALGLGRHATTALLRGEPGSKAVLVVQSPQGAEKTATLIRLERKP